MIKMPREGKRKQLYGQNYCLSLERIEATFDGHPHFVLTRNQKTYFRNVEVIKRKKLDRMLPRLDLRFFDF